MPSCYSILECYNPFSGVKLSRCMIALFSLFLGEGGEGDLQVIRQCYQILMHLFMSPA